MGPQPNSAPRFSFGPFEYDSPSGELRKHGSRLRLQGQPCQILSILLECPGQVVTREEIQRQLWSGTTFVDFEHGLNAAMNKLRQTLGDSADQPRYVETIPGRGYRFIGPIQRAPARPVLEMTAGGGNRIEKVSRERRLSQFGWSAAALLGVALGAYLLGVRSAPPAPPLKVSKFSVLPPPGWVLETATSQTQFALSPDGSRLAFNAMNRGGDVGLFLRDFDALQSRLLPEASGAANLFWPHDGRALFFLADGQLRRVFPDRDTQQVITDQMPSFNGAVLLPSGTILLGGRQRHYEVSVSGGAAQARDGNICWPQLLPGGEHVLFTSLHTEGGTRHRARIARLGQLNSAKELVETNSRVLYTASVSNPDTGHLIYVRSGHLLAHPFDPRSGRLTGEPEALVNRVYAFPVNGSADFSVSESGTLAYQDYVSRSQLVWLNREGRQTGAIGPGNVNLKYARVSPDGRFVATSIYNIETCLTDIWLFDLKTGAGRRLIAGPGYVDTPVWSPDSRRIAFFRAFETPPKLFMRGIGEKDVEEALPHADFQIPSDWSRDGRFIVYTNSAFADVARHRHGDVWAVDLARNRAVIPLLNTPFHEANAAFSPDVKWLAFTSNESGRTEVYVQAFHGGDSPGVSGERYLASRAGAQHIRWRPDGKELFYLGLDGKVYGVPVAFSPEPRFGAPVPLFEISVEARMALHSVAGFDVSPDGRRFVAPTVTSPENPSLVVVQNWEGMLKARRN